MPNDRELLEAAARAAGYDTLGAWDDKWGCLTDYEGWTFDPLQDDGDALRLVISLALDILRTTVDVEVVASLAPCIVLDADTVGSPFAIERLGDDPAAAIRRAIVRCAAAVYQARQTTPTATE
jgi:hypothetical protein